MFLARRQRRSATAMVFAFNGFSKNDMWTRATSYSRDATLGCMQHADDTYELLICNSSVLCRSGRGWQGVLARSTEPAKGAGQGHVMRWPLTLIWFPLGFRGRLSRRKCPILHRDTAPKHLPVRARAPRQSWQQIERPCTQSKYSRLRQTLNIHVSGSRSADYHHSMYNTYIYGDKYHQHFRDGADTEHVHGDSHLHGRACKRKHSFWVALWKPNQTHALGLPACYPARLAPARTRAEDEAYNNNKPDKPSRPRTPSWCSTYIGNSTAVGGPLKKS